MWNAVQTETRTNMTSYRVFVWSISYSWNGFVRRQWIIFLHDGLISPRQSDCLPMYDELITSLDRVLKYFVENFDSLTIVFKTLALTIFNEHFGALQQRKSIVTFSSCSSKCLCHLFAQFVFNFTDVIFCIWYSHQLMRVIRCHCLALDFFGQSLPCRIFFWRRLCNILVKFWRLVIVDSCVWSRWDERYCMAAENSFADYDTKEEKFFKSITDVTRSEQSAFWW